MNFKVEAIPRFEKDIKNLKNKFPKLKTDLTKLLDDLVCNPELGVSLGENFYKIRIANTSIPTGKVVVLGLSPITNQMIHRGET